MLVCSAMGRKWGTTVGHSGRRRYVIVGKEVAEKMKLDDKQIPSSTASTSQNEFFDFGEIRTVNVADYSSKAALHVLHFLEDQNQEWNILEKYTQVNELFFKYNNPLPSSAPVERLFSYATITNSPKCNRVSDELV